MAEYRVDEQNQRELKRIFRQLRPLLLKYATFEQKRRWLERLSVQVTIYDERVKIRGVMTEDVLELGHLTDETAKRSLYVQRVSFGPGSGVKYPAHHRLYGSRRLRVLSSWDDTRAGTKRVRSDGLITERCTITG
jgi:hypothetical protein